MNLAKKVELNIWVDKDLDIAAFIRAYKCHFHQNIDFVYFRVDFKNYSSILRPLMANFQDQKSIQLAENKSSNGYIDPRDINECLNCTNLKYASKDDVKVDKILVKFPNITNLVLRFENFLNNTLNLQNLSKLVNLKIVIK